MKKYKIYGIIEHIKRTQKMVDFHESYNDKDTASAFMINLYERIIRKSFKELLEELQTEKSKNNYIK